MKRKLKDKILDILPIIGIIIGICFISYSGIATLITDYSQTRVVSEYEEHLKSLKKSEMNQLKEKATVYNETIARVVAEGDYKDVESANEEIERKTIFKLGEMEGYITIPSIDVALPIYEGTEEGSLYKGVGHMSSTSLPCGGKSTHCVLAGHSALSSATLFDNLDKLKIGDVFFIKFFDDTLEYKIDKILNNVDPYNSDEYIQIKKGKDYVTLLTCTPKTINSHRLLVRGTRVKLDINDKKEADKVEKDKTAPQEYVKQQIQKKEKQIRYTMVAASAIAVTILLIFCFKYIKAIKRRKDTKEEEIEKLK